MFRSPKNLRRSLSLAVGVAACAGLVSSLSLPGPNSAAFGRSEHRTNTNQTSAFHADGSGTLLAMLPDGKKLGQCPLKHTDVKACISGYVSRVSVKQTFSNPFKNKIEAVYTFPLPEDAAVDEMIMRIGDRVIKGSIKKREEARQIYNEAKAHGHVASLLDQERPNIFTQSVANIEPGEKVEIEIKYVEMLKYDAGKFTFAFPTVVGPRFMPATATAGHSGTGMAADTDMVPDASKISPQIAQGQRAGHDISIALDIEAGVTLSNVQSKLHEIDLKNDSATHAHLILASKATIPNKDFVVTWDVAGDEIKSGYLTHRDDKSGYFTLMLLPPKRVTPETVAPKEMIFLIDCSGSQYGPPLEKAKETMEYIVDHMNTNDTFQIVGFSSGMSQFPEKPAKVNDNIKAKAKQFIKQLQANGGTWMAPAVEKVCSLPNDEHRLRIVTFMTDGYVGNDFEVLGMIKKFRGTSRWFSFGTGNSVNRFLIDGIAKEGGGEAEYVLLNTSGNAVGKKFYDRISSPVLTDVKLDFGDLAVKDVYPKEVSDVWAEKPLYIKGRYTAPGAGTITLSGYAQGKPYKQTLKVNFPEKQDANEVIKPMWARAKVDRLMSEDWAGAQQGAVNKELKDEIVQTALDYHIMTQYTSFVAVEEKHTTKPGPSTTVPVAVDLPDGVSREHVQNVPMPKGFGGSFGAGSGGGGLPAVSMGKSLQFAPRGAGYGPGSAPKPSPPAQFYSSSRKIQIVDERPTVSDFREAPRRSAPQTQPPLVGGYSNGAVSAAGAIVPGAAPVQANQAADRLSATTSVHGQLRNKKDSAPQCKLDPLLQQIVNKPDATIPGVEVVNGKVSIKITLKNLSEETLNALKKIGFELVKKSPDGVSGRISVQALSQLQHLPSVQLIEAILLKYN